MNKERVNNRIRILPDFIANQIAAGEVVQRPESVVKELVENSLDAGAESIAVIVKSAGKQLIHIIDNGSGMDKDDLELSVKRHATSKIIDQQDLERIMSYGFRGEALASIASVAGLEIRSKRSNDEHGWKLTSDPTKEPEIEPCMTDNGTQIFVRNLFYNVPARRKFLRTNLTEFRYISDTMIKFALSRPKIRFTFYDDDTLIFDVKPSSLEERIKNILGPEVSESLVVVESENQDIKLTGFTGTPNTAKTSRTHQYLFLNGRSILSKSLSHAVYSAYDTILEKNQYPFFLLNIYINPENIDINVHPQKHEVKFDDERFVYNAVNNAIMRALQKGNFIPLFDIEETHSKSPFIRSDEQDVLINKNTGEVISKNQEFRQGDRPNSFGGQSFRNEFQGFDKERKSSYEAIFGSDEELFDNKSQFGRENFVTLHNSYIFTETEKGGMLVDQHAAHVRILYENALRSSASESRKTQELLYPINISLSISEIALAKELASEMKKIGFDFKISGEELKLTAVPMEMKSGGEEKTIRNILSSYDKNELSEKFTFKEKVALVYAQNVAIKPSIKLSNKEIRNLLDELMSCSQPYATPNGKPTLIEFSIEDLRKRFNKKI